jgi:hypothetical protein
LSISDANQTGLDITNEITVSAWINAQTLSGSTNYVIASKYNTSGNQRSYVLVAYGPRLNMTLSSNGTANVDSLTANNSLSTGTWYHVAGVYDGSYIKLYINGELNENNTGPYFNPLPYSDGIHPGTADFNIGAASGGDRFDGIVDEVRVYNRALTGSEIADLSNWGPGPVGHWKMDENMGTGTDAVKDSSGNGNDGTMHSSMTESDWIQGKLGSALEFDDTDDEVDCGSDSSLTDLPMISVGAWIRPNTEGENNYGRIVDKADTTGPANGWTFVTSTTERLGFEVDFDGGDLECFSANNTLTLDTWQHVAATWDGTTNSSGVQLYLDGAQVSCGTSQNGSGNRTTDAGESLRIGNDEDGARTFDGIIDDVRSPCSWFPCWFPCCLLGL